MATKLQEVRYLALYTDGERVTVPVGDYATGTVQARLRNGTWGGAVLTVVRSNDGEEFHPLEEPQTLSAPGQSETVDVFGMDWLGLEVTTPTTASDYPTVVVTFRAFAE